MRTGPGDTLPNTASSAAAPPPCTLAIMSEPEPYEPDETAEDLPDEIYPGALDDLKANLTPMANGFADLVRSNNGRPVRDYKHREMAIAALKVLHGQPGRKPDWQAIADAVGYKDVTTARNGVSRLLARHEDPLARDYYRRRSERRLLQDAQLDEAIEAIQAELARPGPFRHDVKGNLLYGPDGEPVVDMASRAKMYDSFAKLQERRARLWGADESKQARDDQIRSDERRQRLLDLINQLKMQDREIKAQELERDILDRKERLAIIGVTVSEQISYDDDYRPAEAQPAAGWQPSGEPYERGR